MHAKAKRFRGAAVYAWALLFHGIGLGHGSPFVLTDQYCQEHRIAFDTGQVQVLLFANREGAKYLEAWIHPLYNRYREKIAVHGVATLTEVPGFMRPVLRALFRRSSPHPVLLDWNGVVSEMFSVEPPSPHLVVMDPEGNIGLRLSGPAYPEKLDAAMRGIDALLESAPPHAD